VTSRRLSPWRAVVGFGVVSLAADMVLRRVDEALDASYAELVLCGVDLGSYGHESGGSLAGLLATLLEPEGRPQPSQGGDHASVC